MTTSAHVSTGRGRGPSSLASTKIPPPRVRTLPPSAFADTWRQRPREPVKVGIRLVGEDVIAKAQQLAVDFTSQRLTAPEPMIPTAFERVWVDMYNSQIQRCVLCHALTKHDDVSTRFFDGGPVNTIEVALRAETMRALWEDYEDLSHELSPVTPEATDDEIASLGGLLAVGSMFVGADANQERRIRRKLARVREEVLAMLPDE